MGCNCKKKIKQLESIEQNNLHENKEKKSIFLKIIFFMFNFLIQICVVFFGIGLFIIISPIALIYLVVCILLRKEARIRIKKFRK